MKKSRIIGYAAGIVAGISYGINPLFGKQLLEEGVSVYSMLFFRYIIAAAILGLWMLARGESFKVKLSEFPLLVLLGIIFGMSSLGLFESYRFIPAGLATTIVYLYPVFTAILMIILGNRPSYQSWIAIFATLAGVYLMCRPEGEIKLDKWGVILAAISALSYSVYITVVNNSKRIESISAHTLTFYALLSGSLLFFFSANFSGVPLTSNIRGFISWSNLIGLAIFPTMVAMLSIAVSTRHIGATKTAVLGVFEPITAIAIGIIAFSEKMTVNICVGISICVLAVIYLIISKH